MSHEGAKDTKKKEIFSRKKPQKGEKVKIRNYPNGLL